MTADYQERSVKLERSLQTTEAEIARLREEFLAEMIGMGWQRFDYFYSYYGSHSELGEGDREIIILFGPSVDFAPWSASSFSHGHFRQSPENDRFEEWIGGLPSGSAVWV